MKFKDVIVSNHIPSGVVDGKDIINLYGNSELGKLLSPYLYFKKPVMFIDIPVYNLNKFMIYLSRDGYSPENFTKPYGIKNGPKINSLPKITTKNYFGLIVTFLILRLRKDRNLYNLLKNSTLPINAYNDKTVSVTLFGNEIAIKDKDDRLHGLCRAIEYVRTLINVIDIDNDELISKELEKSFPCIADAVIHTVDKIKNSTYKGNYGGRSDIVSKLHKIIEKTNAYKDFQKGEYCVGTVENKIGPNDDDDNDDERFDVMLTSM